MSLPRLYIETTIPSYLVARPSSLIHVAAKHDTTKLWWRTRRQFYELFISDIVLQEVRGGDPEMAAAREASLATLSQLEQSPVADALALQLIDMNIIPEKAAGDAAHIAIAAVHGMDFLLTWNCKHINNAMLKRRIEATCSDLGFRCPVICTPDELR
jgi:hypothetical protein